MHLIDGGSESELRLALRQAVVAVDGLGGMVHLAGGGEPQLRLASALDVPLDVREEWRTTDRAGGSAPALALRSSTTVWLSSTDPRAGFLPLGTGMAAVPLTAPEGGAGALSVITTAPDPPSAAEQDFLRAIAQGVSACWRHRPPPWQDDQRAASSTIRQVVPAPGVGVWDWDVRSGEVTGDEALLILLDIDPKTFDGRVGSWAAAVHPDDLPRVMADIAGAFVTRRSYTAEYRLRRRDHEVRWVQMHGWVAGDDRELTHVGGTVWDNTELRNRAESTARTLRHMADGFVTADPDWTITSVNIQAERLFEPTRTLLGRPLWELPAIRSTGLEARCRQATAQGSPAEFDVQWSTDQRWYRIRLTPSPHGPALHFADITDRRLWDTERSGAEQIAAERIAQLGRLTTAFARAVTVRDVMDAIAAELRPLFGAVGLMVQFLEGDLLLLAETVGYSPEFVDRVSKARLSFPAPSREALQRRTPVYLTSRQDFMRRYPEAADHAFRSGKHAWVFLPLIASGRPLGCCVISFAESRRFTEEEHTLLTAVSGLMAQALERARLYDDEHRRATELQRGLLPRDLPILPTATTASRYLPTGSGVGGDWYDVVPLSADRVAFIIGDVMGHGLPEAATMGRLRTAVHTLTTLELPPDELLAQLNDLVSDLGDDSYATCLYALYDPVTRVCTMARAGHPPPALLLPGGSVRFPDLPSNPPLGAAAPPFETGHVDVPDGTVLVLYTDGLVESASRDIDNGMEQLGAVLAASHKGGPGPMAEPLDRLCDALVNTLWPGQEASSDDAAMLVARVNGLASGAAASWDLSEGPVAAGEAREHVRRQLGIWHLDDLVMATEVIASELVGNGIRHARGPLGLRLLRGRVLTCEVSDHSLTTPRVRRALDTDEGGRGLQLVAALSQKWGTRYTVDGKCIWTEQSLPSDHDAAQQLPLWES
ncbi:ATP-binding SpoIIE family protein phosphatase [Streptomyces sp. NPDC001714]|uniref:ATP-binding SpoIIE family protein phosphatase n=1 Tax=Streptomyces sp. NPDC001714 TaxID=3364603 RepID=UPI003699BF03